MRSVRPRVLAEVTYAIERPPRTWRDKERVDLYVAELIGQDHLQHRQLASERVVEHDPKVEAKIESAINDIIRTLGAYIAIQGDDETHRDLTEKEKVLRMVRGALRERVDKIVPLPDNSKFRCCGLCIGDHIHKDPTKP